MQYIIYTNNIHSFILTIKVKPSQKHYIHTYKHTYIQYTYIHTYIHAYIVVGKLFLESDCDALNGLVAPLSVRIVVRGIPLEDNQILVQHTYMHTYIRTYT